MARFRKKPVVIEAEQFNGHPDQARALGLEYREKRGGMTEAGWYVPTLEGMMRANIGDWIITGVKNEKYPCRNDIFLATYDPVVTRDTATEHPDGGRLG